MDTGIRPITWDTRVDYPLDADVYDLLKNVKAKTFSRDFDEQLDIAEKACGRTISFSFTKQDIEDALNKCSIYSAHEIERIRKILYLQKNKYEYLFTE